MDDEPEVRGFIASVLRTRGWTVVEAGEAEPALAFASLRPPDLVVTDYDLPAMTGLVLTQRLLACNAALPVLMVSGLPEAAAEFEAVKGSRTAFATKPFGAADLLARIDSIVD